MKFTRRDFIKAAGAVSAVGMVGVPYVALAAGKKVVVVGGGVGGATAAKYLKRADASLEVTLIEANDSYHTCFMSNEVLSGDRTIESIKVSYEGLKKLGINLVHDTVTAIDAEKKTVTTQGGKSFPYDRCVVSPGIDFKWDDIKGYTQEVAEKIPHAWKAGPQTVLLRKQLEAMADGGTVLICAPADPFRCPPGPYERASQIAHYFKQHKPKSKIIILDAKDKFSKQALFMQGYEKLYPGMIEWVGGAAGGIIEAIQPDKMTLIGQVQEYKGDVINLIPHQKAGALAHKAGLADESGWCPVDQRTFASKKAKDLYVIGDACIAGAMPKSGYSANSQAKVCAAAIIATLGGQDTPEPSYVNTCYSLLSPEWGISVAAVYQLKDDKIVDVDGAGGLSPLEATAKIRATEARYGRSWYQNITAEMFN